MRLRNLTIEGIELKTLRFRVPRPAIELSASKRASLYEMNDNEI